MRRLAGLMLALMVAVSLAACAPPEDEPEGEPADNGNGEAILGEDAMDIITDALEEAITDEGLEARLHDIEYDADANQVNATIDYQEDPVLSAEDLVGYTESFVWGVVEATPEVADKEFNMRAMAITTIEGDDDIIHWGDSRYVAEEDEYHWRDGPGMDILD